MSNWSTIKLGDYYDFSSGLSKSANEFGFGFPFLSFSDVFWNYFVPDELEELVNSNKRERESCSVLKGDIFLTRTSETADELGMSCVALKDYPETTFNGFTKRLRPKNQEYIDPFFIGFYLRSPYFRALVSSYSSIITRASLNNEILGRLKITIPNIIIQRKIGNVLFKYNTLIENNNRRITLLEKMAESIYKEWFVRMRFPGYEKVKYVDGVPEGWEERKVGEILQSVKRSPKIKAVEYNSEGLYPIIDQGEGIIAGYTNKEELLNSSPLPIVVFGDHTRRVKYIDFPFASGADGTQLLYPTNKNLLPIYFYLTIKNIDLSNYAYARHFKFLKGQKIFIPTDNLLALFNSITHKYFNMISLLRNKNMTLQKIRNTLLPKLINGKLSVEHLVELEGRDNIELGRVAEPNKDYLKSK